MYMPYNTHKHTPCWHAGTGYRLLLTSVYGRWFRGSDRVRGISLITWDEKAKRYSQHEKDGQPLSWSSPRTLLLFLNFFPIMECWCEISNQISSYSTAEPRRTEGPDQQNSFWNILHKQRSRGQFDSLSPYFSWGCAVWSFVVLSR